MGATFCPHFLWVKRWIVDRIVDKGEKLLITTLPKKFNVDYKKPYGRVESIQSGGNKFSGSILETGLSLNHVTTVGEQMLER